MHGHFALSEVSSNSKTHLRMDRAVAALLLEKVMAKENTTGEELHDPFGFQRGCKIRFGADPPGNGYLFRFPQEVDLGITLGADKAYDAEDFVNELRSMTVTPHVAQNTSGRSSAIDARTTRHGGYAVSQRVRKRIEEAFGWIKTVARQEKTKFRGRGRVGWAFTFAAAAYNLVRLPKLIAEKG